MQKFFILTSDKSRAFFTTTFNERKNGPFNKMWAFYVGFLPNLGTIVCIIFAVLARRIYSAPRGEGGV